MRKIWALTLGVLFFTGIFPGISSAVDSDLQASDQDIGEIRQQYFKAGNPRERMIAFSLWKDEVIQMYVNKQYEETEQELELLTEQNPDDFSVFKFLSEVLFAEEKTDKAISNAQKFLVRNPDNLDVLLMLSRLYLDKAEPVIAEKYVERAISLDPDNYDACIYMGQALILDNRQLEAVYYFSKAQNIRPQQTAAYSNLGQIYFDNGEYSAAIEQANKGLNYNQNNLKLLETLFFSYQAVKQNKKAMKTAEVILALDPDNDHIRMELAGIYLNAGKYYRASRVLEAVSEKKDYAYQKNIMLAFSYGALAKVNKVGLIMATHPGVFAVLIGSVVVLFLVCLGLIGGLFLAAFLIGKRTRQQAVKFENIQWSLHQSFFVCIVLFTLPLIMEILLGGIIYNNWLLFLSPTKDILTSSGQNSLLSQLVTVVLTSAMVFWFALKRNRQTLRDLGFRWVKIKKFFFLAVQAIIMIFLFNILYMGLFSALAGKGPEEQYIAEMITSTGKAEHISLLFFFVVIAGPLAEEIIFRGFIFSGLRKHCSFITAGMISSFIFGIFHMQASLFIPIAFMGFIFARMYERTRSILPSVIVHMLWNLISFLNILFFS